MRVWYRGLFQSDQYLLLYNLTFTFKILHLPSKLKFAFMLKSGCWILHQTFIPVVFYYCVYTVPDIHLVFCQPGCTPVDGFIHWDCIFRLLKMILLEFEAEAFERVNCMLACFTRLVVHISTGCLHNICISVLHSTCISVYTLTVKILTLNLLYL